MNQDNNINSLPELIEPEDYRSTDNKFSHQINIMKAYGKAIENGCHEMRAGWFNEKSDGQTVTRIYIEDTRLRFIESVKTLMNLLERDYDSEAEVILEYEQQIEQIKQHLLKEQWDWWNKQTLPVKHYLMNKGEDIKSRYAFDPNKEWWQIYVEQQLEAYRAILSELGQLIKRRGDYQEEDIVVEDTAFLEQQAKLKDDTTG